MKQSKRKIRKTNIKKRTKKYNYRKNQRGGWGFFSSDPQIITAMMKFPGFENIQISFPFKNIQMDISLPDKLLNKALDEWGEVTCYNSIKQQLTDRNNQQKEMRMNKAKDDEYRKQGGSKSREFMGLPTNVKIRK